jgi:diguanylate cyclase (GGDEF)-like protein
MSSSNTERLLRLQSDVLEAVARGEALIVVADMVCRRAEILAPEVVSSVLLVEAGTLHPLAAPSLPLAFSSAIEGLRIGPSQGSCGTAAYRKEAVLVTNIAKDPLWDDYRHLVEPLGFHACWSSPIRDRNGDVVATFAFYYTSPRGPDPIETDIVRTCVHLLAIAIEHEQTRKRNHRLAYYDPLTSLPNRSHFIGLITRSIAVKEPFGLLLVDIDDLKMINDTVGHPLGDILIKTVAERLVSANPHSTICRVGGDEFAVIVDNCHDEAALSAAAYNIINGMNGLIEVADQTVAPHVSVGGALFGDDGLDSTTLRQNADFALDHAKSNRRGGYVHFEPALRTAMIDRANIIRAVDKALAEDRIQAFYQPIVSLETAEIVGLEALVRMQSPEGRIIAAGEFHTAFSDPRIAWSITGRMMEIIAADCRRWIDMGLDFQHVGINVTTGDFQDGDLECRLVKAFNAANVPLSNIMLEVNEAVYVSGNDQSVPKAVSDLRKLGILVALDDFGTGYASLTHLLSFPVDVIKIDRSFVTRLNEDKTSSVIVSAVAEIARQLNMQLVVEGIETTEQSKRVAELGCKLGQGYLFARPSAFDEVTKLLQLFARKLENNSASRLSA